MFLNYYKKNMALQRRPQGPISFWEVSLRHKCDHIISLARGTPTTTVALYITLNFPSPDFTHTELILKVITLSHLWAFAQAGLPGRNDLHPFLTHFSYFSFKTHSAQVSSHLGKPP